MTTKWQLCEVKDVLTNPIVGNSLQYMQVSNHPIIHLKYLMVSSLDYFSVMLKNTFLQEHFHIFEYKLLLNLGPVTVLCCLK